jgi:hypothetical protein
MAVSSCVFKINKMKTETLFLIGVLVLFFLLIIIWIIRATAYLKGYDAGVKEVTRSMLSTATWLGAKEDKSFYNTLWLFASKYRKYKYVCSDSFRSDILSLDNKKRITDLPKEDIERLV